MVGRIASLCLITTMAMFARNLILAALFSPRSLSATLVPLLAMILVAGRWGLRDRKTENAGPSGTVSLTSPVALDKVLRFGLLFVVIQILGTLLTRLFGVSGMFVVATVGGLISSASTTAAAATMAMHGQISPALAGSATVLASLASAAINLPIVWRTMKDKKITKRLTLEIVSVVLVGIAAVAVDRVLQLAELLLRK